MNGNGQPIASGAVGPDDRHPQPPPSSSWPPPPVDSPPVPPGSPVSAMGPELDASLEPPLASPVLSASPVVVPAPPSLDSVPVPVPVPVPGSTGAQIWLSPASAEVDCGRPDTAKAQYDDRVTAIMAKLSLRALATFPLATMACSEESLPPPPLSPPADTDGNETASSLSVGSLTTAGTSGLPAHCVLEAEDETGTGDAEDTAGFKFDVGAPEGGTDFPVSCDEVEGTRSNLGCEFWAVDLPNDYRGTPQSPPASQQQFAVVVANTSALESAEVRVYVGDDDVELQSTTVEPGAIAEIALDPLDIEPRFGGTEGLAYRVSSSVPITAYQFNPLDNQVEVYSNDASLLLPTHALARDYTAATGDAILLGMSAADPEPVNAGAFVAVVATEDDTLVEVTPTATLVGDTTTATLSRGQVLHVISDATGAGAGNLSGTRVVADRPVAVFAGNVATAIPADGTACCADHIEHQLPPHDAWGTAYAMAPPPSPVTSGSDPAVYRITAAFNATALRYCPLAPAGAPDLLGEGQTATFVTDQAFTVESDPDKPFAITQFLQSNQALSSSQPGDPAMLVAPSVGQFQRRYLFAVPAGYAQNFAMIVTRGQGSLTLDGDEIPAEDFAAVGVARGQTHHFVQVPLDEGPHTIESDVPAGVTVIGLDDAVSYGYPGGAGLRVIAIPPAAG